MRKGLKIGMLAVALLATMTAVISTAKVEAEGTGENKVTVEISPYNNGVNNCSGSDYEFSFSGSSAAQSGIVHGTITCKFGSHIDKAVTLQLQGDVSNGSTTIPTTGIYLKNGTWTADPESLGSISNEAVDFVNFHTGAVTLFNKANQKIGDATGTNIDIKVVVPEGQPNGTYTGTLVLQF